MKQTTEQKIDKILIYIEGEESLGLEGAVSKQKDIDNRLSKLENLFTKITSVPFLGGIFVGLSSGILLIVALFEAVKKYI